MSKTISQAIEEIQSQIQSLEEQARPLKVRVNTLCEIEGIALLYANVDGGTDSSTKRTGLHIKSDEFTADKIGRAARRYLEMRCEADSNNRTATIDDIAKGLKQGGFDFRGRDPVAALNVSIGKSSHTFRRVNDQGHFGLTEWYGSPRAKAKAQSDDDDVEAEDIGENTVTTAGEKPIDLGQRVDDSPAKVEMSPQ